MDMKNDRIIKFLCCLFMVTQIIGCSDWIEAEPTILPEMKYKELTPEEVIDIIKVSGLTRIRIIRYSLHG